MRSLPDAGGPRSAPGVCPLCRGPVPPGAQFCGTCGFQLTPAGTLRSAAPGSPSTEVGGWAPYGRPAAFAGFADRPADTDGSRTDLGLTLMIIGFLLGWIPYVNLVGGILLLIGIFLLFLGRRAHGTSHRRVVVQGSILVFLGVVGGFVASLAFTSAILDDAATAGATLAQVGALIKGDLLGLFVASVVLGTVVRFGEILLVYRLSTRTIRILLWSGLLVGLVLGVATLWYLLPQINSAIDQATGGTQLDLGPIDRVEATSQLLSLTGILPSVLFAAAYYLAREEHRRVVSAPG